MTKAFDEAKVQKEILLVTFGADWCPWCQSLYKIFHNPTFTSKLPSKVRVVDIGMYVGKTPNQNPSGNEALKSVIALSGQSPTVQGFPFISLVNPDNGRVVFLNTGDLEENTQTTKGHSESKLQSALASAINQIR